MNDVKDPAKSATNGSTELLLLNNKHHDSDAAIAAAVNTILAPQVSFLQK